MPGINPHCSICNLAVHPDPCLKNDISLSRSQLGENKPCEILVSHIHEPVLVGHMNEANINAELIMNNEYAKSCKYYFLCKYIRELTGLYMVHFVGWNLSSMLIIKNDSFKIDLECPCVRISTTQISILTAHR